MQRPVLFWHNYKSVTTVLMDITSRENSEGLRIPCCISKVSGHLGASASSLKILGQCHGPLETGAHTLTDHSP